ncbi:hypothetical protein VZ95_08355 [Elstera litoralis]|uniref:Uncharacterized protein n=1 Tax=Elstera litoralis TaxID=552518 RepID=A0A0F3IT59_9PROT|nr:hypothetical protein VZ95_08355 [Elstera litoralis]
MKISLLHTVVFNFIKFYVFIFLYGLLGPYESLKVFGYSSLFTVVAFVVYAIAMAKIKFKNYFCFIFIHANFDNYWLFRIEIKYI